MASSKSKKRKHSSSVKVDWLSNLPPEIKEKILTYLPIKEAGRTSILSSKWRYTWTSIPELKFIDNEIISDPYNSEGVLIKFVDTIFLLHNGPIRKFSLVTMEYCINDVNRWIMKLSRNGIREITLHLPYEDAYYQMHSSFFFCDELNYINLMICELKLPLWFKGFKFLHTLVVSDITICAEDFEKLVSSCTLLMKLILIDMYGVRKIHATNLEYLETQETWRHSNLDLQVHAQRLETVKLDGIFTKIQMHAPNLDSLEIIGRYLDFQLYAPKLSNLCIQLKPHYGDDLSEKNFVRYIGDVPVLKKVHIKNLKDLPIESWTVEFLLLSRLKYLSLDLNFEVELDLPHVLELLEKVIYLQVLDINLNYRSFNSRFPAFWENVDAKEDLFKHLKKVNIVNFRGLDSVLSFVKFILGSASQLLTLAIEEDPKYKTYERMMYRQLLRFRRASTKAEIIFK